MAPVLLLPRCTFVSCSDHLHKTQAPSYRSTPPFGTTRRNEKSLCFHPPKTGFIDVERRHNAVLCKSAVDRDFVDAINETSNQVLSVILECNKTEATNLTAELQEMRQILEEEGDADSSLFLKVLQGMLQHTLLKDANKLDGMYAQALNRIYNQVAGSEWKLVEEGKNPDLPQDEEPRFSTWEEATGSQQRASSGAQASTSRPANTATKDRAYYTLLGISDTAGAAEIKAAYRKQALRLHPDVSDAPDATQQFAELSNAYDVLSDPKSRALYDEYGLEGMQHMSGAAAGRGNARQAWDEFKPYKKENKHTKARDRARASAFSMDSDEGMDGPISTDQESQVPEFGDVVEYPLREVEIRELQDGRIAGVGLVVGRNMDRGDAAKLPEDQLDLCEIEPLRQEEAGSTRWLPDDLGIPSFARLHELRKLPIAQYDGRHDLWTIDAALSPGCGGPELPEEIML